MKVALLVIDMQKAFFNGNSKGSMENAAEYINCSIDLFRENNKKIVWIQDENEDGSANGTEEFGIIELFQPLESEKRIIKRYGNSFNKKGLLEYFSKEGIYTIIITGYCAEYCVLRTYVGAKDHDLVPIILKNAIASGNNENIKFGENISEIMTVGVLEKFIKNK
jgi:nicotinamidase-related amidase